MAVHGAEWFVRYAHVVALAALIGRPAFADSNRCQERCQENGAPPRALFDHRCKIALVHAETLSRAEALEEKSMRNKPEPTVTVTAPLHALFLPVAVTWAVGRLQRVLDRREGRPAFE
jgi:hypothetical protein